MLDRLSIIAPTSQGEIMFRSNDRPRGWCMDGDSKRRLPIDVSPVGGTLHYIPLDIDNFLTADNFIYILVIVEF